MTITVTASERINDLRIITIENDHLRVTIIPAIGGRIWSIVARSQEREMLWHAPGREPEAHQIGTDYDDMFVGGWDEMFPNDQPITFAGRDYPDHGELWTTPATWMVESDADHVTVTLEQHAECTNSLFQKRVTLRDGESKLRLEYQITNLGDSPLTYQWTLHPALPVTPNARLDLPARRAMLDTGLGGNYPDRTFAWPHARHESGSVRDFRSLPEPDDGDVFQFWATDLEAGWAALTYPDEGIGFGFAFDPAVLHTVAVFATFGGWRGFSTLVMEPSTGRLLNAPDATTAPPLAPGQSMSTSLVATIYEGIEAVAHITPDGDVAG